MATSPHSTAPQIFIECTDYYQHAGKVQAKAKGAASRTLCGPLGRANAPPRLHSRTGPGSGPAGIDQPRRPLEGQPNDPASLS